MDQEAAWTALGVLLTAGAVVGAALQALAWDSYRRARRALGECRGELAQLRAAVRMVKVQNRQLRRLSRRLVGRVEELERLLRGESPDDQR